MKIKISAFPKETSVFIGYNSIAGFEQISLILFDLIYYKKKEIVFLMIGIPFIFRITLMIKI